MQKIPLAAFDQQDFESFNNYYLITGIVGCSVTACIDKCSCCEMATRKYYDGAWMRNQSRSTSEEEISCAEGGDDNLAHEDDADEVISYLNIPIMQFYKISYVSLGFYSRTLGILLDQIALTT